MFNFFKKFKPVSDADGEGKGAKEKTASSLATAARRRDDKAKDKSSSQEGEVGVSSFETKKTDLATSTGAKRKDSEWKFGEAKEPPLSVQQRRKKTESVTVKADESCKEKLHLQNTSRASVMGNTTATMTSPDDGEEIGRSSTDLAKCATTTYTNRQKQQYEAVAAAAAATVDRSNLLMSRATPADLTMVIKTQLTEENELTRKMTESEPSPWSEESPTSEKQMEQQENEK